MVVVIPVLRMLPFYKLCREKTPDSEAPLVWIGHSLDGLLAFFHKPGAGWGGADFLGVPNLYKDWQELGWAGTYSPGKDWATNGNV